MNLGCGGGRNAGELLTKYPEAHVIAIDYSDLSVEKAKAFSRTAITAGRCEVFQGNVSDLRLQDSSFDLATAFETVYFWPGLEKCFAQVARILKSGGIFMICNESDGADDTGKKYEGIIDGMKCYTAEQLLAALKAAGFSEMTSDHHPSKPWITVIGRQVHEEVRSCLDGAERLCAADRQKVRSIEQKGDGASVLGPCGGCL